MDFEEKIRCLKKFRIFVKNVKPGCAPMSLVGTAMPVLVLQARRLSLSPINLLSQLVGVLHWYNRYIVTIVTLLHWYVGTLLHCYIGTTVTLLHWYTVTLVHWYIGTIVTLVQLLHCHMVTLVVVLQFRLVSKSGSTWYSPPSPASDENSTRPEFPT